MNALRKYLISILFLVFWSAAFGMLLPDLRYNLLSIGLVLIGRPLIAISLAVWVVLVARKTNFRTAILWGLVALVVVNVAGTSRLLIEGHATVLTDRVSIGVILVACIVQIVVFVVFASFFFYWHRYVVYATLPTSRRDTEDQ